MIEVDHSAGHANYREDGLLEDNMNVKYGRKREPLRSTSMVEGYMGPGGKDALERGQMKQQVRRRGH